MNPLSKIKALEEKLANYEKMIEDCNEEKQQWKQCCHTLAGVLTDIDNEGLVEQEKLENALEQFKKLRDNDKPGN